MEKGSESGEAEDETRRLTAARPLPKRHVVAMHGGLLENLEVVRHQSTRCLADTPVSDTQRHTNPYAHSELSYSRLPYDL